MRELDTLRVSGSAGRVDDRAEVVGLDPREARRDLRRTRRPMTDPFRDLLVDQRNRLQRAAHLELGRQLGIRRDGKSSARVLDDLVGDLWRRVRIDRNRDRPDRLDAEIAVQPLEAVLTDGTTQSPGWTPTSISPDATARMSRR